MSSVIAYKCPACGGTIDFDINLQKMKCSHCDNEFSMDEVKSYNEELANANTNTSFDDSSLTSYTDEEQKNLNVYECSSCGAQVVADANTSSTTCPYCQSSVILKGNLSGAYKPDYVIPFKHKDEEATPLLAAYLKKKLFVPSEFKKKFKIEDMKGMYCPFWIYDAGCDANLEFTGKKTKRYTKGDYDYKETEYYKFVRHGKMQFEHIPVDGSKAMPDDLMESIEPYDFSGALDFEAAYLSGHLADKYDVDKNQCEGRAMDRCRNGAKEELASTISGSYEEVEFKNGTFGLYNTKVKYALYPVWVFKSTYKDKEYSFGMNGQTGKVVGNMPFSIGKYLMWFAIMWLAASAVFTGIFMLACYAADKWASWPLSILFGVFFGLIAPIIFCHKNRKATKDIKMHNSGRIYIRDGSVNIITKRDIYLRSSVERTKRNK